MSVRLFILNLSLISTLMAVKLQAVQESAAIVDQGHKTAVHEIKNEHDMIHMAYMHYALSNFATLFSPDNEKNHNREDNDTIIIIIIAVVVVVLIVAAILIFCYICQEDLKEEMEEKKEEKKEEDMMEKMDMMMDAPMDAA